MQQNVNSLYVKNPQQNFQAYQPPQALAEGVKRLEENPMVKQAQSASNNIPALIIGGTGITAGLLSGTSYLNKQLHGEYADTVFGKIESKIDAIAGKPTVSKIGTSISTTLSNFKNKLLNNSEILRSIFTKPSVGGPNVQSQAAGTLGHLATLSREYMTKYDKAHGTAIFKDILEKTAQSPHKYIDELEAAIKAHPSIHKELLNKPSKYLPKFLDANTSFNQILNKIKLVKGYKTMSSTAGQKTAGVLFRSLEALSNGMTGGKLAIIMQAVFIGQSLKEGLDAPKGDRFKKFAESMAGFMAMMMTMGVSMKLYDAVAGMKFIGMSKENYAKYHGLVDQINVAAKEGNKALYESLTAQLKGIKGATKTRFWQKPFSGIGKLLSWGRLKETVKPLKGSKFYALKMAKYGGKFGLGYAGRFALIGFGVVSLFSTMGMKVSHMIFGKPKESLTDKKEEAGAQPNNPENAVPGPSLNPGNNPNNPSALINKQSGPVQNPNQSFQPGNLVNGTKPAQVNAMGSQPLANQPIASQPIGAQKLDENDTEPPELERSYIPNPMLGPESDFNPAESRTARIDALMRQADNAEAQAQKFLNG